MEPVDRHPLEADVSFDGGDLDCGNGLLLLIRQHIDPLERGQLLEFRSTEISVEADFPAWCRMTGNDLISLVRRGKERSFLVCKGKLAERRPPTRRARMATLAPPSRRPVEVTVPPALPQPAPVPAVRALSVMGIGSGRLDNCQLIPLTDLLPLVDDPEKLEKEMRSLDVPASEVRHPALFGPLGRSRPLAGHEHAFARTLTDRPVKVALPGPYLLTRLMWLECVSDRVYHSREHLAEDVVRVLREELHFLLAAGVALVQLDEPVLAEVVFTGAKNTRSFMCGALSEKGDAEQELAFATELLNEVVHGLPMP